ncbi:universal stress protein [Sphingomonas sp. RB3P16]|uniref:universal stress protein n=1 Tax=Parasphingomonas frigoris TaxID=3096163 RepID=UPI002FC73C6F
MIKTILAIVEGPVRGTGFIDAVLGLAEYRQAHVIFDILTAAPLLSANLAPLGTLYTLPGELRQLTREHASSLRTLLPPGSQAEVVSHCDDVGWIPGDLRATAPLADMIVIGPGDAWSIDWLRRRTIETVLVASGTPVLLLPPGRSLRSVEHAVLGWKPEPAAMRALHHLVALAAPGARIDVVAVKHGLDDLPETVLDPVVALLSRHGFSVKGHALDRSETPQERLTSFALDRGADLLVVGGFAHSRVREILLGGVTRSLIGDPRLPVLMVH